MRRGSLYSNEEFKSLSADERIGVIIADGAWYHFPKWKKAAKVTEEELSAWIAKKLDEGVLIQSPTKEPSYRFPIESVRAWHSERGIPLGTQLVSTTFPPWVWDGITEAEGFLNAPRREVGVVTFNASSEDAEIIKRGLAGIARLREDRPGTYKAYCLSATFVREEIRAIIEQEGLRVEKINIRNISPRRELVDFSPRFLQEMIAFYCSYGKSLVVKDMETIQIFLPDHEDRDSQMVVWVINAIEKFDETACVPFAGYFSSVMNHWPYDLPNYFLGKDLSKFLRDRSKAIASLRKKHDVSDDYVFTSQEIAEEMGIDRMDFLGLEERYQVWIQERNAGSITWTESPEERRASSSLFAGTSGNENIDLTHKVSYAAIEAALETQDYDSAFALISQIDAPEVDQSVVDSLSPAFVFALSKAMGNESDG